MSEILDNKQKESEEYVSQQASNFRDKFPAWLKQFPYLRFPQPKSDFKLIDTQKLREELKGINPEALQKVEEDIEFLEYELLRLFRERDYRASREQNRYRKYQIGYMGLAAVAGIIGALQAITLTSAPQMAVNFAFAETVVAAFVTFLATIAGNEPPLSAWLMNRRRAEFLRREYFRYLLNLEPYDTAEGFRRQQLLSTRAADINRGVLPDRQAQQGDS